MRASAGRVLVVAAACLVCAERLRDLDQAHRLVRQQARRSRHHASIEADPADPATTGSVANEPAPRSRIRRQRRHAAAPRQGPLRRSQSRQEVLSAPANFGLAEKHFRRAVELHPRDAEAWVGLAASYDRLKRFDLADRAYAQAAGIIGDTPELLNNKGFSYILRGDYVRARRTLDWRRRRRSPNNPVHPEQSRAAGKESQRRGKAVELGSRSVPIRTSTAANPLSADIAISRRATFPGRGDSG